MYDGPVKDTLNEYKEILPEGIEVGLLTKIELEALVNNGATLKYGNIKNKIDAKGYS